MPTNHQEKTGIMEVVGGIRTEDDALAIRAGLTDLPGVRTVSLIGMAIQIRYDSQLIAPPQLYEAAKIAGFKPREFHLV